MFDFLLFYIPLPGQDNGSDCKDHSVDERDHYSVSAVNQDAMSLPCLINKVQRSSSDGFDSIGRERRRYNVEVWPQEEGCSA